MVHPFICMPPTNPVLQRAGVQHAATVLVLCSRSGVNVDTAIEADREVSPRGDAAEPGGCRVIFPRSRKREPVRERF